MYYNSKTGQLQSCPPWGNSYVSFNTKILKYEDWTEVENNFIPPAKELTAEEKRSAIDAEYQPQFAQLSQDLGLAILSGNTTTQDAIKSDYASLKTEYENKLKEVN